MSKKWVYLFTEVEDAEKYVNGSWDAVRSLLGGKGAGDLAYTRFRAQANGQTAVTFQEASLSDPQGSPLTVGSQTGAEVSVGAALTYLPLVLR